MPARILIVEDNRENLTLMKYLLEAFGHRTITAGDGAEALELLHRDVPDLIVCDIQLPRVDGYEVARAVKEERALARVPLLAVTAYAMVGDRERVLSAGFDGYIPKPINPETFVAQVEGFLPAEKHSTFHAAQSAAAAAEPQAQANHPSLATILVVDNSFDNIQVARAILEPSDYEVLAARRVEEALEIARRHHPDLILSDVHLAGESGFDLIRRVKSDTRLRSIPFVFISSTSWAENDLALASILGAETYIKRPIEPRQFLDRIEKCLKKGR